MLQTQIILEKQRLVNYQFPKWNVMRSYQMTVFHLKLRQRIASKA